ncbi:ABC transporter substrate-binding protein [Microlunatus soli]|uniref:Multiple sugar transport system substrate-binding protein n=1 Tax=Microlunatus soli TaxID=630515 RepID=A0A1H1YMI8_9ACTN|nr:extracellular solute-binding protein [Microlunatus soli]SDT22306.1 multiple sugar transport system substrate-binding protein [Microlunatus soli]
MPTTKPETNPEQTTVVPWRLRRRTLLGGAGAIAAGSLTSGCAVSASQPAKNGKKQVTLKLLGQANEIDKDVIAGFTEQRPDIKLSITEYSWDALVSMLAAKTPPDLVRGAGATDTPYLVHRSLAEPLDDYLKSSKTITADDLDPINDLWRYDGTTQGTGPLYGLVKDYSSDLTLWVNSQHLKAAGLKVPSSDRPLTYKQVLKLSEETVQRKSGRTRVLGFGCVFGGKPDLAWLQGMLATADAALFNDDLTQIDLTSDAGVEALQWFVDLVKSRTTSSFLDPQATADADLYVASRVATLLSGYWTSGLIATAKPQVQQASYLLPAPMMGTTRVSPCVAGTGFWIPKTAAHKEAAWAFMEYYFAAKPAVERAKSGWGIPGLKSLAKYLPDNEPYQKRALAVQRDEQKYFKVLPFTPYAKADALGTALATTFEDAVRAHRPIKDTAAAITTALNAAIKRGKN